MYRRNGVAILMQLKDKLFIYHSIRFKYKNNIFKNLGDIICAYIYHHPDLADVYLNPLIKVENLLNYLASQNLKDKGDLLRNIVEYVEGEAWKNT